MVVHYGPYLGEIVDAQAEFAPLFGALQEAIGRARKLVSLGETGAEFQELLFDARRLLAMMEQCAQLAPEDTRDSLLELCDGADRSLAKVEQAIPNGRGVPGPESTRRAL
jgi:hypothetical protein